MISVKNDPISGCTRYRCQYRSQRYPISGLICHGPISGHIETDIDTDIGYSPISGHFVTDIVTKYPISVLISGPISGYRQLQQPISVSISDTISGDTRYRCQCSDGIPISGPQSPDIGVNDYDQTVTAAAWIPQGFTKVMMRCS